MPRERPQEYAILTVPDIVYLCRWCRSGLVHRQQVGGDWILMGCTKCGSHEGGVPFLRVELFINRQLSSSEKTTQLTALLREHGLL